MYTCSRVCCVLLKCTHACTHRCVYMYMWKRQMYASLMGQRKRALLSYSPRGWCRTYTVYTVCVCCCSMNYDVFAEKSPVEPSVLQPAKWLQWNISPETAADIQTASRNMDKWAECMLIFGRQVSTGKQFYWWFSRLMYTTTATCVFVSPFLVSVCVNVLAVQIDANVHETNILLPV